MSQKCRGSCCFERDGNGGPDASAWRLILAAGRSSPVPLLLNVRVWDVPFSVSFAVS
jgi:hypothetical protein